MAVAEIQKVLEELVGSPSARDAFSKDKEGYLTKFPLSDEEKKSFDTLSVDCLLKTAKFLNQFNDAELSIGSVWIKDR
ncbi:hypothetical protein [Bradyrhizobium sp. WYCCWR 12699]|uniref:hypothetical protein n=1 Tax=Bradyrhizobium sp. WYCCWR 12699 TaxID=3064203 RepID=UPI0028A3065F|nr:hypothetical protein [Bradyrhizobium sp. WYCCWR 12699]MDT4737228.1 hypothetical protein [Bradyrhizobium sp. WYCCWR 12699]